MAAPLPTPWDNWIDDYGVTALRFAPKTKDELIEAVRFAVAAKKTIRAVGSGHSMSPCAKPRPGEFYVDMCHLNAVFDEVNYLKSPVPGLSSDQRLVRIQGGTRVKTLNRVHLADRKLALINMGTFDGQTISGAIATGTHGTGIRLGALADCVQSIDLVTVTSKNDGSPEVVMRRIEPTNGITDRAAFDRDSAKHGMVLEQNDDTFYSAVVGFGCMGIAFAYTFKVREAYWLRECSETMTWPKLADLLRNMKDIEGVGRAPAISDQNRHCQLFINIAEMQSSKPPKDGGAICLVTRKDIVKPRPKPKVTLYHWPPERDKESILQCLAGCFGLDTPDPTKEHNQLGGILRNKFFEKMAKEEHPFAGKNCSAPSYIALRRERDAKKETEPPDPPPMALSTEIGVPADRLREALDALIAHIKGQDLFFAVPLGIRFTAPSKHYLSAAYGRATAYIEVAMVLSKVGKCNYDKNEMRDKIAKPALSKVMETLCTDALGGRPHLGKFHSLGRAGLERIFPKLEAWLAVYRRFNAFGTFDNSFTDALGLTGERPAESTARSRSRTRSPGPARRR
jgi:hypothetical protein